MNVKMIYIMQMVFMGKPEAQARKNWKREAKKIISSSQNKQIGKIDIAYNTSENFLSDIFESVN